MVKQTFDVCIVGDEVFHVHDEDCSDNEGSRKLIRDSPRLLAFVEIAREIMPEDTDEQKEWHLEVEKLLFKEI